MSGAKRGTLGLALLVWLSVWAGEARALEKSLYLYGETPKFFPAICADAPAALSLDWWHAEEDTCDDNVYCLALRWNRQGWAGVCWLGDEYAEGQPWGPPGIDLSGATRIALRARTTAAQQGRIKIDYLNQLHSQYLTIGADWQEYTLPVTDPSQLADTWFLAGVILDQGSPDSVFVDDVRIVFERAPTQPVTTAIAGSIFDEHTARLIVDGRSRPLRGAGYGVRGSTFEAYDLETLLPALEANTIRTWGNECTFARLDRCAAAGAGVLVGYWLPTSAEFAGRYGEPLGQRALRNDLGLFLDSFRDHPAVLGWLIGNEVYFALRSYWDAGERRRFFEVLDTLMVAAKTIDPGHVAGYAGASLWPIRDPETGAVYLPQSTPHLDFYGANMYGDLLAGALAEYYDQCVASGYDKPVILTEFGPRGWWEIPDSLTAFNDPAHDAMKADEIRAGWDTIRSFTGIALGGCVFNWIDKRENEAWTRWGVFGGEATGDRSREWRAQAEAVRAAYRAGVGGETGDGRSQAAVAGLRVVPRAAAGVAEIGFTLRDPGPVIFEIVDVAGRRTQVYAAGWLPAGARRDVWALPTSASGIYWLRVVTPRGAGAQRFGWVR